MNDDNPHEYCFMIRNGRSCVKTKVAKRHLKHYECEKCVWRIHSEDPRHLNSLKTIFEKYGNKNWK